MGASQSSPLTKDGDHILKEDLAQLNEIVSSVVNEKNVFKNNEYNFLSQDVCKKYQVILESDLKKQLKINIKSIGESLLLVPREEEHALLAKRGLKKDEICTRIANHYLKILYILCLVKYVFNIERHGDLSFMGIFMRNIEISKDTFRINYCKVEQKDLRNAVGHAAAQLDFSNLEGLRFFVDYVLNPDEATVFLRSLRHVLARKSRAQLKNDFCDMNASTIKDLEELYTNRYSDIKSITCTAQSGGSGESKFKMMVAANNPLFDEHWCVGGPGTVTIPLAETDGKEALRLYKTMRSRFNKNIKAVENILYRMVEKRGSSFTLKDITKDDLDSIIADMKTRIKIFYLQSLMDFQDLLDRVKSFPKAIIV